MSASSADNCFLDRLNQGTSSANELDGRYRSILCRLVEKEINQRYKRREEPEDIVQSAFRTFYRRNAQGEFHIDSSADLWRLLETIARRKLLKHIEYHDAEKRNPGAEEYLETVEFFTKAPTAEEVVIAADLMEMALAGLDETYVKVFHMRLNNCTEEEIAQKLGTTRAFVRGKLNRLRNRLEYLLNVK
jgi:RNA polymerase sigma-70 factor (ECF subfamily)